MKLVCILSCVLSLICCKYSDHGKKLREIRNQNISTNIQGRWYLNRWTMFHTLDFTDKTVFVDNHVDTVFTLNYSVSHDTLITWSGNSDKKYKNKIIYITRDTFVINGFAGSADTINYSRIKSGWKH